MANSQRNLNDSLQLKLSIWLSGVVIAVALLGGYVTYTTTIRQVNVIQDDLLRQIASLFDANHLPIPHHGDRGRLMESDEESRVVVQYLTSSNSIQQHSDGATPLALPENLPDGLQTLVVEDESYRVLVKTISTGERIAIAQETAIRNEIAESSALHTLLPFLLLVPILLVSIALIVRKLFNPINALAKAVDLRSEQDLSPINVEDIPLEIRPFLIAINQLFERISLSIHLQRRFVADAAHELRTPITALSLQAEHLSNAEMSNDAKTRTTQLLKGLGRTKHLLNQLLELARLQSMASQNLKEVSIKAIYRDVLEDLYPLAEAKKIDVGITEFEDTQITADETDLRILVKNIVDNAIRYSPVGGHIDLSASLHLNQVRLVFADNGSGIESEYWERIMDPFFRVSNSDEIGSGLGLSIVKQIVDKLGGQIQLEYTNKSANTGLTFIVTLNIQS